MIYLRPQKGFQENALATAADIAILGGAAGAGKTFTLLLEPTRHYQNKKFTGVIFRRTTTQVRNPGGLWDTASGIYPGIGARMKEATLETRFASGAWLKFAHMEHEGTKLEWQGAQITFIAFDELCHFSESQVFYMLSRNRSPESGVRGYMRATCNPDPTSWVARFIEWWIDQETGFPIPERAGKLRYFTRDGDNIVWGDSVREVVEKCPHIFNVEALQGMDVADLVKSVTFIPGSIYDNNILVKNDPSYLGSLLALPPEERAALLDGNWKELPDDTCLFDLHARKALFTNYPEQNRNATRYITVDAARFGRDFCVLYVWKGWEVIHVSVFKKSDVNDIVKHIEELRRKFNVMIHNVIVDQDGVGGGAVKIGRYRGFKGGSMAMRDPDTRIVEYYHNLKTQCYYRIAQRVNAGQILMSINAETCLIFDDSALAGVRSTKIKVAGKVIDIRDLIEADLRAIKRAKLDQERKQCINTKDEQKNILGRSPDFGDTLMMREFFELKGAPKTIEQQNAR